MAIAGFFQGRIIPAADVMIGSGSVSGVRRRNLLLGGLAPFLPRPGETQPAFRLRPRYRSQTSLDAAAVNIKSGADGFLLEKDHDRIAAILADWSRGLLAFPRDLQPFENALARGFTGPSPLPVETKLVRRGSTFEVRRVSFASDPSLSSTAFMAGFRSSLIEFSRIISADFQITRISALAERLLTRIRYELTGEGDGFHREQRQGYWDVEWLQDRVIVWRTQPEIRSRSVRPSYADITRRAFEANSSYSSQLLHGVDYWRTVLDGACGIDIYGHNGVSVGDIDNSGLDSLYVCQPAGLPNRLYRNKGDGTLVDITAESGVGILDNTACALFIDVDNDGRQDLIVVRANGPMLFLNEGGGKFRPRPNAFRFAATPQGTFTGAAAADYDHDGWLDIYFCLYTYYQGADQYKYPVPYYDAENGPPNFLMRNNGDGTFRDVTREAGLGVNNTRFSFCCGWSDYDRDGWPDLYVVNDFGRKNLYHNNGDGTFTDVAAQAGVEDIGAGMSVSWFDYDNDGAPGLYSADMWTAAGERISTQAAFQSTAPPAIGELYRKHAMGNSLFRNSGHGAFEDKTAVCGASMGRWAWSSDAWDFDHDGWADLYIVNGMISGPLREDLNSYFWRQVVGKSPNDAKVSADYEQGWQVINELIRSGHTWSGYERNVFYANNGDGTFCDVSGALGLDFLEDGRSFALADFDQDGRQEIFLKNRNSPQLRLLHNVMDPLPPSIAFRLRGRKSNRDAIGAVIVIETETGQQTRALQAGSGFLSQHSKEIFFGLGASKGPVLASIHWPSGLVQQLNGLKPNHRILVEEGSDGYLMQPFKRAMAFPASTLQEPERFPDSVQTWLLSPIAAPESSIPATLRGQPILLTFVSESELQVFRGDKTVRLPASGDQAAVYNILYRYLFDCHRDLPLPSSFLIDREGMIVKVYQGPVQAEQVRRDMRSIPQTREQRLAKALPFAGEPSTYEFARNQFTFGAVFYQRGYFEQAAASFSLALKDDPTSGDARYGLGSSYLKLNKTALARECFEQAAKLPSINSETKPNAWNNLGLLAARDGRTSDAIGHFQEALRLNPAHLVALENLGNAYRQQKRWNEARSTLEKAVALGPNDPEANYSLAMVYAQIGDSSLAYDYLRQALQLRPNYPEALNNLGVLYLRTERRDEAVSMFEECIRVAPGFDQSYLNLARVHTLEGHPEKARAVLLELLRQHPDHAAAIQALKELP